MTYFYTEDDKILILLLAIFTRFTGFLLRRFPLWSSAI